MNDATKEVVAFQESIDVDGGNCKTFTQREPRRIENIPHVMPKFVTQPNTTGRIVRNTENHPNFTNDARKNKINDLDLLRQISSNFSSDGGPFVLLPLSMLKHYLKPGILSGTICGNTSESQTRLSYSDQSIDDDSESIISEDSTNSLEDPMDSSQYDGPFSSTPKRYSPSSDRDLNRNENTRRQEIIQKRNRNVKKSNRPKSSVSSRKRGHENVSIYSNKKRVDDSGSSAFCKVCGDKASTHVHYGGRSCASCRAFFRRSVEAKAR